MTEYSVTSEALTTVAEAIRAKGGTSAQLVFPGGFADAVAAIQTGGGGPAPKPEEEKSVTVTQNGYTVVTPSPGKTLFRVSITTNVPTSGGGGGTGSSFFQRVETDVWQPTANMSSFTVSDSANLAMIALVQSDPVAKEGMSVFTASVFTDATLGFSDGGNYIGSATYWASGYPSYAELTYNPGTGKVSVFSDFQVPVFSSNQSYKVLRAYGPVGRIRGE